MEPIDKPLDGEIIPSGQPLALRVEQSGQEPTLGNGGLRVSVDILGLMTADCQEEVNFFKNWNEKWRGIKAGTVEGPILREDS